MGLIINREIEAGCRIGLWEITEDYETLFRITRLSNEDIIRLNGFKNLNRKIESLSVRALLQQMTHQDARIVYRNQSHKPFLDDGSFNISVSHSNKYTSVMLGKNKQVGVDLEFMSHDIERVAHKFINKRETITNNPLYRRVHIYIHWCAKEALYKISDRRDINFLEDMRIKPFDVEMQGCIVGEIKSGRTEEYRMYYQLVNNCVWVYCMK